MSFPSGCHTHSTHCDGKHTLMEMLTAARDLGFTSFGFSAHAAQGLENGYSMTLQEQEKYFEEARSLRHLPGFPRAWAGLELDALAHEKEMEHALKNADYILGSTHYVYPTPEGVYTAVDGPADALRRHADTIFGGDGLALAKEYFQIEADFITRIKPHVIGHFDLIRKSAAKIGLFDENDPAYRKIALNALERCFPVGSVLEVNTGGMARGYLSTPYPTFELLCAWREMGGEVTLASDCHDKALLNFGYDEAEALIRKAGFDHILMLGPGDKLWETYELA